MFGAAGASTTSVFTHNSQRLYRYHRPITTALVQHTSRGVRCMLHNLSVPPHQHSFRTLSPTSVGTSVANVLLQAEADRLMSHGSIRLKCVAGSLRVFKQASYRGVCLGSSQPLAETRLQISQQLVTGESH